MRLTVVAVLLEAASFLVILASHFALARPRRLGPFLRLPYFASESLVPTALRYHPRLGWVSRFAMDPGCGLTTDRYGFIHNGRPERDFMKARRRIFITGGSAVAGVGTSCNDATIAARLEQLIKETGHPDVAVINAGVSGYYSALELAFVVDEILRFQPDVILSLTGTNDAHFAVTGEIGFDAAAPIMENTYAMHAYHRSLVEQRRSSESVSGALVQALLNVPRGLSYTYTGFLVGRGTAMARGVFAASDGDTAADSLLRGTREDVTKFLTPGVRMRSPDDFVRMTSTYARYLAAEQHLLEGLGVRFVCAYQPVLLLEPEPLAPAERQSRDLIAGMFAAAGLDDAVAGFRAFKDAALDAFARRGVACADATQVFAGRTGMYVSPWHYSDAGQRVVAEFLRQELVKKGALSTSSGRPEAISTGALAEQSSAR